jgi:pimeloyl-ACP methyl ester carboxylesterase
VIRMVKSAANRSVKAAALAAAAVLGTAGGALAQSDIGVVLMHGKQSPPGAFADMSAQLRAKGMKVMAPAMPWARGQWERISVTVEAAHQQIDGMVAQLRAQGARRIVVGGHSIGANVALSYAAQRGNVAGVILIAPGHQPPFYYRSMLDFRAALERAAGLVQSGQGGQPFSGPDNNQGRTFTISTTAEVYLSWMSPQRLANMSGQAPRVSPRIPVMMIIGSGDPAFAMAQSSIYQPAAKHAYSKYVAIQGGDHISVLGTAGNYVSEWLQGLPAEGAPQPGPAAPRGAQSGAQTISQTCQRFEGTWTSRGPSGTIALARTGATWSISGTGSPAMSQDGQPVRSVQRTGSKVEVVTANGTRLELEENARKLTGTLAGQRGVANVDMTCVR